MKKEKNLSFILPSVYIVFAYIALTFGLIFDACIILTCNLIAIYLIDKNKLHIGKYMPIYIITVLLSIVVIAVTWIVFFEISVDYILIIFPAISAILILLMFYLKIKDLNERIVIILTSPIVYYMVFIISFFNSFNW